MLVAIMVTMHYRELASVGNLAIAIPVFVNLTITDTLGPAILSFYREIALSLDVKIIIKLIIL